MIPQDRADVYCFATIGFVISMMLILIYEVLHKILDKMDEKK